MFSYFLELSRIFSFILKLVMINNWSVLTVASKKQCREVFEYGLVQDSKPEVQKLAQAGMVAYLSMKPARELQTIAEAFVRNSEALATRSIWP